MYIYSEDVSKSFKRFCYNYVPSKADPNHMGITCLQVYIIHRTTAFSKVYPIIRSDYSKLHFLWMLIVNITKIITYAHDIKNNFLNEMRNTVYCNSGYRGFTCPFHIFVMCAK